MICSTLVKKFLTKELSTEEIYSYYRYLDGDSSETGWIEKVSNKRDELLNLKCSTCRNWINISEEGICKCSRGHSTENQILHYILRLES